MRKIFIVAAVVIVVFICNNCATYKGYYEGHIYTTEGEPIPNLIISPVGKVRQPNIIGITDENGYFKFEKVEGGSSRFLKVEFEGKIIDSIQVRRGRGQCFVNGAEDTLFIDIKGEKKSFERHNHSTY